MSTLYWIVFLPARPEKLYGNGTEVEQDVYRTGVSGRYWPRGFGALNPSPLSRIFTSVSVGSSPRSYIPVYIATKRGRNLSDMRQSTFMVYAALRSVTEIALRSPFLSVNI